MRLALFFLLAFSVNLFANINVVATIYPIYSVAKVVGGDKITLTNLVPFGIEPHDYDPTPKDIKSLSSCDIFLTSGKEMEHWSDKIIKSQNLQNKTFDFSKNVHLIKVGNSYDPHYWLSFRNYISMIEATRDLFSQKDTANATYYKTNAAKYIEQIKALESKYNELNSCKNKNIVVNHNAFNYLTKEYQINTLTISGLSPDDKPSAKQIALIVDFVKKYRVNTIFFEEFASDKTAKAIAKDTGVKVSVLNPVENITADQNSKNIGYIDIMQNNLANLKGAMGCQ